MKNLALCFLFISSFFSSIPVFAEKLLNDCEINEWTDANNNPIFYQVKSKGLEVYWLKKAEADGDDRYSNRGTGNEQVMMMPVYMQDQDHKTVLDPYNTSQAVYHCEIKGLHVPTAGEFKALQNCFEADKIKPQFLSKQGQTYLFTKFFPQMEHHWFWSSSIVPEHSRVSFDEDNFAGFVQNIGGNTTNSLWCVGRK